MTTINNGGPAFPGKRVVNERLAAAGTAYESGMTLLSYFAATSGVTWQDALVVVNRSGEKASIDLVAATLVAMRLRVAEAMLRSLEAK